MKILKLLGKKGRVVFFAGSLCCSLVLATGLIFYGVVLYYEGLTEAKTIRAISYIEQQDFQKAANLLKRAYKNNDPYACEFLAWLEVTRGNYSQSLEYARECSIKRSPACLEIMGNLALIGYGRAQGSAAALSYFDQAAATMTTGSWQENKKDMINRAFPLAKDPETLLALVKAGLDVRSAEAQLLMGDMLFLGEGLGRSVVDAVAMWQNAAQNGSVKAKTRLAGALWYGYGVGQDQESSLELYSMAAGAGDPVAAYSLAIIELTRDKKGTEHSNSYRLAEDLLEQAFKGGSASAASVLGVLALGEGSEDAYTEASQWFYTAYKKMAPMGTILYALMLYAGLGVSEDKEEALAILYDEKNNGIQAAGELIKLLAEQADPLPIFKQSIAVCQKSLAGELVFSDDGLSQQWMLSSGEYDDSFGIVASADNAVLLSDIKKPVKVVDPKSFKIDGTPLMLPSIGVLLLRSSPTTGAGLSEGGDLRPHLPLPQAPLD